MKTIVIYRTKTGFTQKYAQWISEDLGCESITATQAARHDLSTYDLVIYGAPVMAGGIMGWKKFRDMLNKYPKVQPVLFACGLAPQNDLENLKNVKNQNLTDSDRDRIPFFLMRGGIDINRMGFLTRFIMKAIVAQMRKTAPAEELSAYPDPFHADYSSRDAIQPLVAWVKANQA